MAKNKKRYKRNPTNNHPPKKANPLINPNVTMGGIPMTDPPKKHYRELYNGAMALANDAHGNKYLLNRNDRTYEAVEALSTEVNKRNNMNENISDQCFISVSCYYPQLLDDNKMNASIAYAFMLRFGIERQQDSKKIEKLLEIEQDEIVQKLKLDKCKKFTAHFRDLYHEQTEEDFYALVKIVYYRLADNYMNFPKNNRKRYGPTWDLYQQILDLIQDDLKSELESNYERIFWSYTDMAMEVERKFQTRNDLSALSNPSTVIPSAMGEEYIERDIMRLMTEDAECLMNLWLHYANLCIEGSSIVLNLTERVHATEILDKFNPYSTQLSKDKDCSCETDPFSFFGGLCLCQDKDKDIAFIPGVVNSLTQIFTGQLPWNPFLFREYKKTELLKEAQESSTIYTPKIWFEGDDNEKITCAGWENIAQVVFHRVGIVLLPSFQGTIKQIYDEAEWTEDIAKLISMSAIAEAWDMSETKKIYISHEKKKEEEQQEVQEQEKEKLIAKERESTEKKLNNMNDQLNDAKKEKNKIDHEKENLKKKLQALEQKKAKEHRELCSLREWVYNHLTEEEETNDEENEQDDFPYGLEKRIVIFGGFDNWRTGLKDKVKNVTFAPKSDIINTDLIKNAESVWIQTNCISHSAFYNIQNIADTSDIPIMYFVSAGILRCARQLVEYDKEQ